MVPNWSSSKENLSSCKLRRNDFLPGTPALPSHGHGCIAHGASRSQTQSNHNSLDGHVGTKRWANYSPETQYKKERVACAQELKVRKTYIGGRHKSQSRHVLSMRRSNVNWACKCTRPVADPVDSSIVKLMCCTFSANLEGKVSVAQCKKFRARSCPATGHHSAT